MYLKDISENITEGHKIINNHYFNKKGKNTDLILCLSSNDVEKDEIIINKETKFIKKTTFQKYYGANLSKELLSYNDILFDKNNSNLFFYKKETEYKILATNDFIIIRPESYLKKIIENKNGSKYLLEGLKEIFRNEYFNKIELIEKIYFPNNFDEIENLLYVRPDKRILPDLKKINIKQGLMTLDMVVKRLKHGEIDIDTENYFQRRDDLWTQETKSRFIEALIVKQPVPAFYFDATNDNKWLIVDGLQRLSAVREFVIDNKLKLKGLYYLPNEEYVGKKFEDLPRHAQRNIEEYELMVYKIEPPTPKEVKYKIFRSINTSALILSKQEIRHALNHKINEEDNSSPSDYIKELSEIDIFKQICKENKITDSRMEDRELVLRYIAFRITPYQNYSPKMSDFLDETMTKIYRQSPEDLKKYKEGFNNALETIYNIFKQTAFRKSMFGIEKEKFINDYFETWTYVFSKLNKKNRDKLERKKIIVKRETIKLLENKDFKQAINNPNTIKNLRTRFFVVENFISKLLK